MLVAEKKSGVEKSITKKKPAVVERGVEVGKKPVMKRKPVMMVDKKSAVGKKLAVEKRPVEVEKSWWRRGRW